MKIECKELAGVLINKENQFDIAVVSYIVGNLAGADASWMQVQNFGLTLITKNLSVLDYGYRSPGLEDSLLARYPGTRVLTARQAYNIFRQAASKVESKEVLKSFDLISL
jgi:hypothetical protein